MTAKSVLLRPQGLRPRAHVPTCPSLLATPLQVRVNKCYRLNTEKKTQKTHTLIPNNDG